MAKLPKVIYITAFRSSFIIKDEELFKQHAQVVSIGFKPIPRWKTPWSMCIQFFLSNQKGAVSSANLFSDCNSFFLLVSKAK